MTTRGMLSRSPVNETTAKSRRWILASVRPEGRRNKLAGELYVSREARLRAEHPLRSLAAALALILTLTACAVTEEERPLSDADLAACDEMRRSAVSDTVSDLDGDLGRFYDTLGIPLSELRQPLLDGIARFSDRICAPMLRASYDYCSDTGQAAADVTSADIQAGWTAGCYSELRRTLTSPMGGLTYDEGYTDGFGDGINCALTPRNTDYHRCLADYHAGVRPVVSPQQPSNPR